MTKKRKAQDSDEGNVGEVWDLAKVSEEQVTAARALLRVLALPGLPAFVSVNLYMILCHAAKVKGVAIGSAAPCGYSVKALADLFAVTSGFQRGLSFEPKREPTDDLARLISAILNHPDTPTPIHNKLSEAVGEYVVRDEVAHAPEVLRVALAVYKTEAGDE